MRAGTSAFQISKQSGAIVSSIDERQKKRIQEVATQTTLYVVVAFITYMPLIINELVLTVILNYYAQWQSQLFGTYFGDIEKNQQLFRFLTSNYLVS